MLVCGDCYHFQWPDDNVGICTATVPACVLNPGNMKVSKDEKLPDECESFERRD